MPQAQTSYPKLGALKITKLCPSLVPYDTVAGPLVLTLHMYRGHR